MHPWLLQGGCSCLLAQNLSQRALLEPSMTRRHDSKDAAAFAVKMYRWQVTGEPSGRLAGNCRAHSLSGSHKGSLEMLCTTAVALASYAPLLSCTIASRACGRSTYPPGEALACLCRQQLSSVSQVASCSQRQAINDMGTCQLDSIL